MNSSKSKLLLFKTILNIGLIGLGIVFLVLLFVFKGNINTFISNEMREQAGPETEKTAEQVIDSAFNYERNGENFRLTFLEFGAQCCNACRRMETVMEEVKSKYPGEVKVNFINVLLPASQDLIKYYGIVAIPSQVLLNNTGREVFRHTGYFSFEDLDKEFREQIHKE